MATKIDIISTEFIKPSSPTPQYLKHHKFSLLDKIQQEANIPLIFFYKKQSNSPNCPDQFRFFQLLKQSLSDALTKFYPLAGRINEYDSIDCNDLGALFVKADVHSFLSQAIQNATTEELYQYLPMKHLAIWDEEKKEIVLGVQINFFQCGGLAIGVSMSHKAGDVNSMLTFLNSWATTSRGKIYNLQPSFDFGFQNFPPILVPESHTKKVAEYAKAENLVYKCFVFGKQKLAELKALASVSSEVKHPSRVEVVSAFISKMLIEIGLAKIPPKSMFVVFEVVNLRNRMKQLPVNEFAFGNLSSLAKSDLLESEKNQEYHNLVKVIRTVTRRFNDENEENVRDKVVAENVDVLKRIEIADNPEVEYCYITSLCKFPFYELDYGWGKPLLVRTRSVPFKNLVCLMDTSCGDGVEALITMTEEDEAMLSDEFLSLAKK